LSWAAEDITRLCFHNERHIYFVVLPPLMPMGGENQVQVVHVDLREKDVHILKVESQVSFCDTLPCLKYGVPLANTKLTGS
jgi:hypothetical protein